MYPTCIHCGKRYINEQFLYKHFGRAHVEFYVLFLQARYRFLMYKRAIRLMVCFTHRRRFVRLKYNVNRIKTIYLEQTYAWHGKGFIRTEQHWNSILNASQN